VRASEYATIGAIAPPAPCKAFDGVTPYAVDKYPITPNMVTADSTDKIGTIDIMTAASK